MPTLEDRLAALEARVAKLESDPITPVGPPASAIVLNSDGSVSVPAVAAFREELRNGDNIARDFAQYIPDKFLVYDESRFVDFDEATLKYVSLNCDRAGMSRIGGSGESHYAFSWIVHKVVFKPGFFFGKGQWEFDMGAGQVMDTLAYPVGVTADTIEARVRKAYELFRREFVEDESDFSPPAK